ncbi:uncharacterized protein B0P05DRAFT_473866, partial [Gilbertella persicaria]|uniref:uncharacterized protein n=1 Tax=Gilbertella persicaria TaxID=101096 RepID=UPI002220389F
FTVVNSATLLESSVLRQPLYFITGLRQGDLFSFKINHDPLDEAIVVKQPYSHNIGSRAVKLLCGHSGVYALCEQLWRLTCSIKDRIQLEQVLLPKFDRFMNTIAPLDCDVPLLWNTGESFAVFADDRLYLFQLSLESKINTNKIYLGQTPKKVLYDKTLNYIITVTTAMDSGKRKNFMRLIDPSKYVSIS